MPKEQVFIEAFGPAKKPVPSEAAAKDKSKSTTSTKVTFSRSEKEGAMTPDETILEVADEIGVEIDNSCRSGQCGLVCKVKLLSGEVTMEVDDSLSEEDKATGLILACQAKASAPVTIEA